MDRFITTVLLSLLLSFNFSLNAQEQDTVNSPVEDNEKISHDNGTRYDAASQHDFLDDTLYSSSITIKAMLDMRHIFETQKQELDSVKKKVEGLSKQNDSLVKLVKRLEPGWRCVLREMAENVDEIWLNKPFGEMDSVVFQNELTLYEKYKDEDKGVGDAYKKLKSLHDRYLTYLEGVGAVNSAYDAKKVKELEGRFKKLLADETHSRRQEELRNVSTQLHDYGINVQYFQSIIRQVDERLENYIEDNTKELAWVQIEKFLKAKDEGKVEKYLSSIPWLKEQYQIYIKCLEKDPYGDESKESANVIKNLKL